MSFTVMKYLIPYNFNTCITTCATPAASIIKEPCATLLGALGDSAIFKTAASTNCCDTINSQIFGPERRNYV